ncbi:quinone oxidoreductase family protein [Streptantibioticus silvisoli]|uniref:Zinc-binding dehydrogenase n=1 Tax=Streptantibioticus silvisoli TaxID=2705255 RepID=A0ABT6W1B7_9ACTN|nr:zinc-binding dehydrogenase [Streptantibioticus silvisoli]MDI5963306.1 zinc-binding dehydrogenase [Streptantibioticus silvisoli]
MRAARFAAFGGPDVLTVDTDVPAPADEAGRVVIEVSHAGVNFAEVMFRRGQFPVGLPHVPGLEAVGTVRSVGEGVTGLVPGQRVAALVMEGGGNAELVSARADLTVPLEGPLAALDSATAAAVPCNVTTAIGVVESAGRVARGDKVLVLAAGGGVGSAAAQLARAAGAALVVGAVSTAAKAEAALAFGYDAVVTYDELADGVRAATGGTGVDVVLDSVGGPVRKAANDLLEPLGRHVVFGDAAQQDTEFPANHVWFTATGFAGYNLGGLAGARPLVLREHFERALHAVASGAVRVAVTELALDEVAKAHELLESRSSTGKFVVRTGV